MDTILSKNPNKLWFNLLTILGITLIITILYSKINIKSYHEGFEQSERFIMKQNNAIYDDFYVELYDKIYQPEQSHNFIIEKVIDMTMPSKKSIFLDIGSGTGSLINKLQSKDYLVYGIDKSQCMVDYCLNKYPEIPIKCGDVSDSMSYDRNSFSHILCTDMTLYQFSDKRMFFRNCYYWLMPNGYIILHLVDKLKFDPILSSAKPVGMNSLQQYSDTRITNTVIDFVDFKYKASYDFTQPNETVLTETMTDNLTRNVRQNELTLYIDDIDKILHLAQDNGFIIHGQVNMLDCIGDTNQFIFILERQL